MKKILAVVMGMIMLMSLAVLPGCNLGRAKPISLASCETVVLGKYHDIDLEWIVLRTNEQGEKLLLSKLSSQPIIETMWFDCLELSLT